MCDGFFFSMLMKCFFFFLLYLLFDICLIVTYLSFLLKWAFDLIFLPFFVICSFFSILVLSSYPLRRRGFPSLFLLMLEMCLKSIQLNTFFSFFISSSLTLHELVSVVSCL